MIPQVNTDDPSQKYWYRLYCVESSCYSNQHEIAGSCLAELRACLEKIKTSLSRPETYSSEKIIEKGKW